MIWAGIKNKIKDIIQDVFHNKKVSKETLSDLEEALIIADLGIEATSKIITTLSSKKYSDIEDINQIKSNICNIITEMLIPYEKTLNIESNPTVILFAGVNGSGKTTTIAKIANMYNKHKVRIVAADTFRAAAVEQLSEWADRLGCNITIGKENSDPASVSFKGIKDAIEAEEKIILIDTAGRLPNNSSLMDELSKIKTVVNKTIDSFERILVLDATIGQHAIIQAEKFTKSFAPSGIIMTKLDGTAKGGTLINAAKTIDVPVYFITVGENINDIKQFSAKEFAENIIL